MSGGRSLDETLDVAIIGAGQGGHALSAVLSEGGMRVGLITRTPQKAYEIIKRGNRIKLSGIREGEYELSLVTTDLSEAKNAGLIILSTDATAHMNYAGRMARHLTDQEVLLISPGIGGSLAFYQRARKANPECNITVSETDTFMFACKVPEIGHSHIKAEKCHMLYASHPKKATRTDDMLKTAFPYFTKLEDTLEVGLSDSPVFHIVGMLHNSLRILNQESFNFYIDGLTPEASERAEKMDEERVRVANALGIETLHVNDWMHQAYGVPMGSLYDMIQQCPPYQNTQENPNRSPAPKTLFHRYLLEEIPLRAVPMLEIGEILGVETPLYKEAISDAYAITGINFFRSGRKIRDMGLQPEDILQRQDRNHQKELVLQ
jgi:opine dehydrogenase